MNAAARPSPLAPFAPVGPTSESEFFLLQSFAIR